MTRCPLDMMRLWTHPGTAAVSNFTMAVQDQKPVQIPVDSEGPQTQQGNEELLSVRGRARIVGCS